MGKYPKTKNESVEQATLFEWVKWNIHIHPELEMLHHIPNGGSRHPLEAANLKKQGVKAGVPDLSLPVPKGGYHGLYIELKAHNNTLSYNQEEWLKKLSGYGYYSAVCWGWEQAKNIIEKYLKG